MFVTFYQVLVQALLVTEGSRHPRPHRRLSRDQLQMIPAIASDRVHHATNKSHVAIWNTGPRLLGEADHETDETIVGTLHPLTSPDQEMVVIGGIILIDMDSRDYLTRQSSRVFLGDVKGVRMKSG